MTYLQIVFHRIKHINRQKNVRTLNRKKLTSVLENEDWYPIYNERNVEIATEKCINIIQTEINVLYIDIQEKRQKNGRHG